VTGLGCVCSLGEDVPAVWQSIRAGRCGIGPLGLPGVENLRSRVGGEVWQFDPLRHFDRQQMSRLDRFAQFGVMAGREAIRDADLTLDEAQQLRVAIVMGSCIGGIHTLDEGFERIYQQGRTRLPPLTVPRVMLNSAVSALSMEFGIRGPCFSVSSACSSANHAILQALWLVRSGQVDVAITGGSEAPLTYGHIRSWEALRVLAPDTCRPFSLERKGLVLAEGAGIIVIESEDFARRRGASIYAELAGAGMSSDASDLLLPEVSGAERAMAAAIADAGLAVDEIDYINAQGSGTSANDLNETLAIHRVFGAHARRLAVSSTKSMHGHALGATGGIEAVATVKAMATGVLPPTINFVSADPECDLDYVPNQGRERPIRAALSNAFAFGGLNAVLAFRGVDGQ
jgi:nodulation protein E